MQNQKLTLQHYRNKIKLFQIKLALKAPQHNFSQLMLLTIAEVMKVDLKVISKLSGINGDRFDWYLVEASGTFDNLSLTMACWQDLGVTKYLAISSQ
ncbi:MAG: hypothetical protein KME09_14240 [Pleurocapsa minor HA4230-MV1]|jgi:hypothetical protein|nr:hypothetical protein [Pleurocapsa minor HA4230-MV1]